jgi:lipoprotein-releasing system permease protein
MSPNLRIAFRFLTAKKRAMVMSLTCIVLGVGLFIITQATTTGFQDLFIETIIGADGAVLIQDKIQSARTSFETEHGSGVVIETTQDNVKLQTGIEEPSGLLAALNDNPAVVGVSPVLKGSVDIASSVRSDTGRVFGVNIDEHLKVSNLGTKIVEGRVDDFRSRPNGAMIGRELADRLLIGLNDYVQISQSGAPPQRFRVMAIFVTGISAMDRERVYVSLSDAASVLHRPTGVSYLQLQLADPARAPVESARIVDELRYNAQPWQERERSWLSAFSALQVSSAITVLVFTLIAGVAMFNTLAMIVIEKTKDIAILRSMGYERTDVTRIFLWQAVIVLTIGAVIGCLFGAAATYGISHMPLRNGGISGIFTAKYYVVAWSPWHYVEAVGTAVVMVMLASVIPARRAARLEPGDIVRGTAQ